MIHHAYLIAMIFGPFLTLLGLWMILYRENANKTYASIRETPSVMFLRSGINMLLGLFIISAYNQWDKDPTLLVTILGWVLLLRGAVSLYAPQFAINLGITEKKMLRVRGILPLVWGLLLIWFAWFR